VPLSSESIANTLLLAADLGGMAVALSLFTGWSWHLLLPVAALIVFGFVWRAPFSIIENLPSLLGLVTLTFWAAAFAGPAQIDENMLATLTRPTFATNETAEYLFLVAGILGAVISPYLMFFYSSGAGEEQWSRRSLGQNRMTAVLGMTFGSTTAIALMVICALYLAPRDILGITLPELGIAMADPLGKAGALLFATALFVTTLGGALEASMATSYNVAQGFGWEWGEDKAPYDAPRFNLLLIVMLVLALVVAVFGGDPLTLALLGSAFTALVLPISLGPFMVLMNDRSYLGDKVNGKLSNIALVGVLILAFVVAVVSMPLLVLSGG
jgi:Mn2+/Fe2+ NRAMP family transporter